MSEQDEKMREEFEVAVNKLELGTAQRDGEYVRADVRDMWTLWQASRAQSDLAHQEEIERLKAYIEGQDDSFAVMMESREGLKAALAAAQLAIEQMRAALKELLAAERYSNRPPETVMEAELLAFANAIAAKSRIATIDECSEYLSTDAFLALKKIGANKDQP